MTKWFVIVAGPNGAGKSTFVASGVIQRLVSTPESGPVEILNPDAYAVRLAAGDPVTKEINIAAANQVETELSQALTARRSIGVETVLSSAKYRSLVEAAIAGGYRVLLHYVVLSQPDLHVGRVAQRVQQGGHDIPPDTIARRYGRSLEQLPWFAKRATRAFVWDNSSRGTNLAALPLIAEKLESGEWSKHHDIQDANPLIVEAMRRVLSGTD